MAGSRADYEALARAIEDHDRKERVANLIAAAWAFKLADQAMIALAPIARACGYPGGGSILEWSRNRVATLRAMQRGPA